MSNYSKLTQPQLLRLFSYILHHQSEWTANNLSWAAAAEAAGNDLGFRVPSSSLSKICRDNPEITFVSRISETRAAAITSTADIRKDIDVLATAVSRLSSASEANSRSIGTHTDTLRAMTTRIDLLERRLDALIEAAKNGRVTAFSEAFAQANEQRQ